MKDTTKAWVIASPRKWYFFFVALALLLAFLLNRSHLLSNLQTETETWAVVYFWVIIWAMLFDGSSNESRVVLPFVAFLVLEVGALLCFYFDCSKPALLYVVLALDIVFTIASIVVGVKLGRWTFSNMDEVISRREKWRKSKVDIYHYSRKYAIGRGIAVAGCLYNAFVVFMLFVVVR